MNTLNTALLATCMIASISLPIGHASANSNMMIILDSSNSMWGQVEGTAKMETAKDVLTGLLNDLPADTNVGLMAYGHRSKDDCRDVETLAPIGSDTPTALVGKFRSLTPRGKTPISFSLKSSIENFRGREEENNNVLLISDGIETCEGDPCAQADALLQQGIALRIHVVGFDVDDATRAQLQCIADKGNGRYFDARDIAGFKQAITDVKQVAQTAQAAPVEQIDPWTTVFEDSFERNELGENWEALNHNPDAVAVEDGVLLVLANTNATPSDETFPNLLRINQDLPSGDWRLTARLKLDLQRAVESFQVGLHDSESKWLSVGLTVSRTYGYDTPYLSAVASKFSNGQLTSGAKEFIFPADNNLEGWRKLSEFLSDIPLVIRLERSGRQYQGSVRLGATETELEELKTLARSFPMDWLAVDKVTMLRPPGKAFIGFSFNRDDPGESLAQIEEIKLEVAE